VGWTAFAGIMMILNGIWWIIAGISAIANENLFVLTEDYIFKFDITTWGWIHLLVGILVVFAGFALFSGQVWARTVGVIVAVLAGLVAFSWIPYYPIWGILFVAISVAVIWSLTAHGDDITMA
jgi:hypothetical protein